MLANEWGNWQSLPLLIVAYTDETLWNETQEYLSKISMSIRISPTCGCGTPAPHTHIFTYIHTNAKYIYT